MSADPQLRAAQLAAIGERVLQARKAKFLNQAEVAEATGMSRSNYATIELGTNTRPEKWLLAISKVLEVDLDWLALKDDPVLLEPQPQEERASLPEEGWYVDRTKLQSILDSASVFEAGDLVYTYREYDDPDEITVICPDVFQTFDASYERITPREAMSLLNRLQKKLADFADDLANQ